MRSPGRRPRTMATALLAVVTLGLLAAGEPIQVSDPCGGGALPRTDICLVTITPEFIEVRGETEQDIERVLESVTLSATMDASIEEWRPNEIREINFDLGDCFWGLKWFHDPVFDLPGELSARLDRRCDGDFAGIELVAPVITDSTISTTITPADVAALNGEISTGSVMEGLSARTYVGAGTQAYAFTQASYNTDQTRSIDVILE